MLSISNAVLTRGITPVFDGLTLQLNEPRIGLIGDNGAGKSSLFRMACGLEAPQSGSVTVQGLQAFRINAQRPNIVGMMFQNPDDQIVFPTVQEELALGLTATGLPRREAITRARAFLATRGLEAWAERAISSLSQGQRQHVCWLAILLCQPALILLDEPFASLDLPGQALLHDDMARASQQIIVSTHVLEHLRNFDRVIWLDSGRVRADGDAETVCAKYRADVTARIAARTAVTR
ncbi:energy-coupling factor ABC transporter ATP-binding protein [Rhodoferax mekongensis]|uniref:energy-coupling factor ABC transporter ATP-binding protein n=1 Tax=Rhodoferax mekongensis TaxID=3068341 RepID=UPI0028BEC1EF|nr:ABC transporter ATP-binding protein [Rhodoferax sp. TBRC 17199]MDT7514350.1 ABC transporter ATP-binding protein [Rhodoferax sp. TBRC 17199]